MNQPLMMGILGVLCLSGPLELSAAPAAPEGVVWKTDIEFSNSGAEHLQLNLARPKSGEGPFPAVLCIHGGGFRAGKRETYDELCVKLAACPLSASSSPRHGLGRVAGSHA